MTQHDDIPDGRGSAPVAAVRKITKRFPGVLANDDISLEFRAGEIHVCWARTAPANRH